MNKITTNMLVLSLLSLFTVGCAGKQYSKPEFYGLPPVKQNELCQEWANTVPGTITLTTYTVRYPTAGGYNTGAEMRADAGTLGSALGARTAMKHRKRVAYNLGFCTARHFADDLPDGYSLYFIKGKEIEFLRSDADDLNIKATRLALDGDFKGAIKSATRALKIQDNPYSYQIQVAVYILAAQNEKNAKLKASLFKKSIESSKKLIKKYEVSREGDNQFLMGYTLYQLNQNRKSNQYLSWGPFIQKMRKVSGKLTRRRLAAPNHVYASLLYCTDSDIYFGDNVDKAIKKSFDEGLFYITRAKEILLENEKSGDLIGSKTWLKKAIDDTEKICMEGKAQNRHIGRTDLTMPSEYLFNYLDDIKFRGF